MAVKAKKRAIRAASKESARGKARRRNADAAPLPQLAGTVAPSSVRVYGNVDSVNPDGTLEGWCWSPDQPEVQRTLVILINGKEVDRMRADQPRADLAAAEVGSGCHAFRHKLDPALLRLGETAVVTVQDLETGRAISAPVPVSVPCPPSSPASEKEAWPRLAGNIDRISRDGWISGWCWFPDQPDEHVELVVLVDGVAVGETRADAFRPDLQQAGIGDGTHGFSFALPYSVMADRGTLTVTVQERRSGRLFGDAITMRIGRMAATEERIQDLERQVRQLQTQIGELQRNAEARDHDRAARALFSTVAAFFQDLAQGGDGSLGLAGALARAMVRCRPFDLARPEQPDATICIAATAPFDIVRDGIVALHAAGVDAKAEIVVLDDGREGPETVLLPSLIRNLRYVALHDGPDLCAARNELARTARGEFLAFLAPEVRLAPDWLDEAAALLRCDPTAAIICGRLERDDGRLHHAGLLAGPGVMLHDHGHLAPNDDIDFGFMRPVDAVSGAAFVVRREVLLRFGGFSQLFSRFGHAVADLCARLRAAGHHVLYHPLARATWHDRGVPSDADPPNLAIPDEETLRLRERLHAGWPAPVTFVGRALVIDDHLPQPDRDAGSIAAFEQMCLLRRLGYHVVFAPTQAVAIPSAAAAALAREGIALAAPPRWPSVTEFLQAKGETIDLVHVYRYANMSLLSERLRNLAPQAKVVFATADLHHLREQRRAELVGQPPPTAMREEELRCIRSADMTIVTSDVEHTLLRNEVEAEKLVLLRWIARPIPPTKGFADRRDICFVGNFCHPPNIDGVQWFVAEVLPLVRQALPTLRLLLAGSDMPAVITGLAGEAVEVLGWVPSLEDLFNRVRLSVAPLRFGAGFKGKVATSLAHGLPVVGSATSFEGTGLADGDGVVFAHNPEDFARAIVRVHEDATLWKTLSDRALDRVAALYAPDAALTVWKDLLTRLGLPATP